MKKIDLIFASTHKFAADAVKATSITAGLTCYTLIDLEEFSYIFEDLNPTLFIVASSYYDQYQKEVLAKLKSIQAYTILCHDIKDDAFDECWEKDLDMFHLQDNLKAVLGKING